MDGVWYWDLENPEFEWMSPEFWRAFGIDPAKKEHKAAEWQDIIFPEDLQLALQNFEAHCADPNHPYDQIVRYRHSDGSTVWIRCRGLAIRDGTGKPIRMLGAHTDLTQVKRSEEHARAGWRAAEAANSELQSFAYSVSHDMKAPANTLKLILNELEILTDGILDDEAMEMVTLGQQTVNRMQTLIEDVLDYTRVIGMSQPFETLLLSDVARDSVANLRADIAQTGAKVTIQSLPEIYGSATQMRLLFQNLMGNAIKFCAPDVTPQIDVFCRERRDSDLIEIIFKDNGIGIPPDKLDRIFTLFQRLHGRDEFDGTGLGLPMCQRIALNHQGNIHVTSQPGRGSEFTLCIPRRRK